MHRILYVGVGGVSVSELRGRLDGLPQSFGRYKLSHASPATALRLRPGDFDLVLIDLLAEVTSDADVMQPIRERFRRAHIIALAPCTMSIAERVASAGGDFIVPVPLDDHFDATMLVAAARAAAYRQRRIQHRSTLRTLTQRAAALGTPHAQAS